VIEQAQMLVARGDCAVIHYDRNARGFNQIQRALAGHPRIGFARRHRCGWGDWSLVASTLAALRTGMGMFAQASHFYLVSGDCMPIQPSDMIKSQIFAQDKDYIETKDFFESGWIKTGLSEERLIYRHPFNERRHTRLFYKCLALQRRFDLRRPLPRGLHMRIGSQWFCLRRTTCEAVLGFLDQRPDVLRFFKMVWIPDECALQTLVWHLVPEVQIENQSPTFLMFTDYGMPVSFHNDHADILPLQDAFFARKVSPCAKRLRKSLQIRWMQSDGESPHHMDARNLASYVSRRGRMGLRDAPRAWDRAKNLSPDCRVLIIVSKKWSVGKSFTQQVVAATGAKDLGYFFDEIISGMPDLGGIARDMDRRYLDPASLVQLIFQFFETRFLVFCIDPCRLSFLEALHDTLPGLSVLELQCEFSDQDLSGHAQRIGLLSADMNPADLNLWPMLRCELEEESMRIRNARLPRHFCLKEGAPEENLIHTIAESLQVPHQKAQAIVRSARLFDD
jgi:hypothetical protein